MTSFGLMSRKASGLKSCCEKGRNDRKIAGARDGALARHVRGRGGQIQKAGQGRAAPSDRLHRARLRAGPAGLRPDARADLIRNANRRGCHRLPAGRGAVPVDGPGPAGGTFPEILFPSCVTVHSGQMGYAMRPFCGRAKSSRRSVTPWMND